MSRDPYRSSGDLRYPPRGGERWDAERFERERRSGPREEFYEERDSRFLGPPRVPRTRERSVDEIYERERRGPRGFEDDRYERRVVYDDEPRYERERPIARDGGRVTIEKEREREIIRDDPPPARPAFLRRQSSLDTFDRQPMTRYVERDIRAREEYGPPARYREDVRPAPLIPVPLPRSRGLPPPRRYAERDYYDEIEIAEPDYYGDESYRRYPERIREREIIRTKRRSRSRSRESKSHRGTASVRSSSVASSSSSSDGETTVSVKSEFPKKGKTRMPARLVSKKAIIDLGYPFEEEVRDFAVYEFQFINVFRAISSSFKRLSGVRTLTKLSS